MFRTALAATVLLVTAAPAAAIERYDAGRFSCAALTSLIARDGAVILRHASPRNSSVMLIGRYVAQPRFCESAKRALPVPVLTRDNAACMLRVCREQMDDQFN